MPSCSWSPWIFNGTKHKINHTKCLWGIRNTQVFVGVRRHWSDMPVLQCYCLFMDYLPSCLPHLVSKQCRAGLPAVGAGSLWRGLLSTLPGGTSGSALANEERLGRERSHWAKHFLNHWTGSLGFIRGTRCTQEAREPRTHMKGEPRHKHIKKRKEQHHKGCTGSLTPLPYGGAVKTGVFKMFPCVIDSGGLKRQASDCFLPWNAFRGSLIYYYVRIDAHGTLPLFWWWEGNKEPKAFARDDRGLIPQSPSPTSDTELIAMCNKNALSSFWQNNPKSRLSFFNHI